MIGSLVENNYNEFGEPIVLEDFDPSRWKYGSEYVKLIRKASPAQVFGLVFSIGLFTGLLGYSLYLHKKLFFRMPWVPPTKVTVPYVGNAQLVSDADARSEAGRISRLQSGIIAMRTAPSFEGEASQVGGRMPLQHDTDMGSSVTNHGSYA